MTKEQEALKAKHGTPEQFEESVWRALGDISVAEARTAIAKYHAEWRAASRRHRRRQGGVVVTTMLEEIRGLPSKPCFHAPNPFLIGCSFCRERWLLARAEELSQALRGSSCPTVNGLRCETPATVMRCARCKALASLTAPVSSHVSQTGALFVTSCERRWRTTPMRT